MTTPYWGMLKELGVWPVREVIRYHRLMLYQSMMDSKDERLGKSIIVMQKESKRRDNWYGGTEEAAREVKVRLEWAKEMKKERWKKTIKEKICKKVIEDIKEKESSSRKMRHQKGQTWERKEYLKEMSVEEASRTMRRRLEMLDIGNNWGKQRKCRCGEKESSEHMIACKLNTDKIKVKEEWLKETEDLEKIRKVNEYFRRKLENREK